MFKIEIGDEFHYLFICNPIAIQLYPIQERHIYLCTIMEIPMFINLNNYLKRKKKNKMKLFKLCRFIKTIIARVSSPD